MRRHAGGHSAHWAALRRSRQFRYIDQFDIEDQVRLGGDSGMLQTVVGNLAAAISQLIGDEEAALAANLHADETHVKAGNGAALALRKRHGLRIAELRLAVIAEHRLAVLVLDRWAGVVIGGVELDAVGSAIARVLHFVKLVRQGVSTGADHVILVA